MADAIDSHNDRAEADPVEMARRMAIAIENADYAWRNTRAIEAARQQEMAKRDALTHALVRAEAFIAGFEDDDTQEGITELLLEIRCALDRIPNHQFPRSPHV